MIKSKRSKSILLITGLTVSISLLLINSYASTYTTASGNSLHKRSQPYNTAITNLKNDSHRSTTLNMENELNVPRNTYSEDKSDTLYLASQDNNKSISRGGKRSYPDSMNIEQKRNKASSVAASNNQTQVKTIAPVEVKTTTKAETKPAAPTAVKPTAPKNVSPITPTVNTNNSANDLDLLARLIMAEAQGEPYDAKVAIGAVVMNRVESGSFADSINGVIYEKINGYYQFTPVVNGWINKPANADSIRAAKAAINGFDATNGAMFYYDNTTTNTWILSKPVSIKIGNMVFAY